MLNMDIPYVILVNENDEQVGVMEKLLAHQKGLLHRAFSVFIVNSHNQLLLQQRALTKYHSPGLWTNACCSHPAPGETTLKAARKRLVEEMGFDCPLFEIDAFQYRTDFDNGLVEHEFDHVLIGTYDGDIIVNPEEVADYKWISFKDLDNLLVTEKEKFTFWFHLAYPLVKKWLGNKQA